MFSSISDQPSVRPVVGVRTRAPTANPIISTTSPSSNAPTLAPVVTTSFLPSMASSVGAFETLTTCLGPFLSNWLYSPSNQGSGFISYDWLKSSANDRVPKFPTAILLLPNISFASTAGENMSTSDQRHVPCEVILTCFVFM